MESKSLACCVVKIAPSFQWVFVATSLCARCVQCGEKEAGKQGAAVSLTLFTCSCMFVR